MNEVARRITEPSPRVRLAAQLYASGSVRSKKEAAEIAGIHPVWFLAMSNHNEPTQRLMNSMSEKILDESVDASKLLKTIGRKALARIVELMEGSANEKIALEAAKDLADRSSETMKTQRLEVASLTLGPDEARQLAAALVESNRGRAELEHVAQDGLIEVSAEALPGAAPSALPATLALVPDHGEQDIRDRIPDTGEATDGT